jgi:hypothetical protein
MGTDNYQNKLWIFMESLTDVDLFPDPVSTGRQGSLRIDQPGWKTVGFISNLNTFISSKWVSGANIFRYCFILKNLIEADCGMERY